MQQNAVSCTLQNLHFLRVHFVLMFIFFRHQRLICSAGAGCNWKFPERQNLIIYYYGYFVFVATTKQLVSLHIINFPWRCPSLWKTHLSLPRGNTDQFYLWSCLEILINQICMILYFTASFPLAHSHRLLSHKEACSALIQFIEWTSISSSNIVQNNIKYVLKSSKNIVPL